MTNSYDYYCDHCCEQFTSLDIASRHLHEMEVHVNLSLDFEDFILEIKRDPDLFSKWQGKGLISEMVES